MTAEQAAALETENAALKAKAAELEAAAVTAKTALDHASARYLKAATRCGRPEAEATAVAAMYHSRGDFSALVALSEALEADAAKFPATPSADVKTATGDQRLDNASTFDALFRR